MSIKQETSSTLKKTTTKKTIRKTPAPRKDTQIASNTRHINENTQKIHNNSNMVHIMYGIIIVLMIIIAGLAYYVGSLSGTSNTNLNKEISTSGYSDINDMTITVIDDERCSDCGTSAIADQLKLLPFLSGATFIEKDFSEKGINDLMKKNGLVTIPIVIFSSNSLNDGGQIVPYLKTLPDGQFSLALPETFDPFVERSENGFLVLNEETLKDIASDTYIDGNVDAKITWLEYSDLECPFCKNQHESGVITQVGERYGDSMNYIFKHFPLDFHPNAQKEAEAAECAGELGADSKYYEYVTEVFKRTSSNGTGFALDKLSPLAVEIGINETDFKLCLDSGRYEDKVKSQMNEGQSLFKITGTPGNVIINNETGEYQVISGAYPASAFEAIIDKMLK